MSLKEYRAKRSFDRTPEPEGESIHYHPGCLFVIQKHAARRLHYDFRLEIGGVLKSWAVPKGPSLDPSEKRLAVLVEDHPVEYGSFEGTIPHDEYGGGIVMLWDRGEWLSEGNPQEGYERGRLTFALYGAKLRGGWTLLRMVGKAGAGDKNWLLIKRSDHEARSHQEFDILAAMPLSVKTGRSLEQIAGEKDNSS